MGFWIACQAPQLIQNCKRKSVAAISVWFLAQWLLGDIFNLVGSFLSDQLTTEKAVAILYVCLDCIICTQYVYFSFCGPNGSCGKGKKNDSLLLKDHLADPDFHDDDDDIERADTNDYKPPDPSLVGLSGEDQIGPDSEPKQVHGFILPVLVGLQFFMSFSVGYHLVNQQEAFAAPTHKVHVWERHPLTLAVTTHHTTHTPHNVFAADFGLHNKSTKFWIGWGIGWVCNQQTHATTHIPMFCGQLGRQASPGSQHEYTYADV